MLCPIPLSRSVSNDIYCGRDVTCTGPHPHILCVISIEHWLVCFMLRSSESCPDSRSRASYRAEVGGIVGWFGSEPIRLGIGPSLGSVVESVCYRSDILGMAFYRICCAVGRRLLVGVGPWLGSVDPDGL